MKSKLVKQFKIRMVIRELEASLSDAQDDVKQILTAIKKGQMDSYSGDLSYAEGYEAGLKYALNVFRAGK